MDDGELLVTAHFEVDGKEVYVYNDIFNGDFTYVDFRESAEVDLREFLAHYPLFAEFLFSNRPH